MQKIKHYVPIAEWLPKYKFRVDLTKDLVAGLAGGVMLVPQGMAYALVANLPPIYGLYSAFLPPVIYAFFGTSRELSVAPSALMGLLTAEATHGMDNPEDRVQRAVLLTFFVGVITLALGFAKAGVVANLLSHSVIVGFTSAAGILVGTSQLKHLFGVKVSKSADLWQTFNEIGHQVFISHDTHWPTFGVGMGTIIILLLLKKWKRSDWRGHRTAMFIPGALIVVILGTALSAALSGAGMKVVGTVPAGLPTPSVPKFAAIDDVKSLLIAAVLISLIGFIESVSIALKFSEKNKYEIRPNQELFGLGMANLAGCFFASFPTTGGFSRTAVVAEAGAVSPMAGAITGLVILISLMFLSPLFYWLPNAVLGGIVLAAVSSLLEYHEVAHIWSVRRKDILPLLVTFVCTLTLGIEIGILIGVGISIGLVLQRMFYPHSTTLGRLPGTTMYRNINRFDVEQEQGVLIYRFDASLTFANVSYFRDDVDKAIGLYSGEQGGIGPRVFVLVANGINDIDSSAAFGLMRFLSKLSKDGVTMLVTEAKGPVRDVLDRAGFSQELHSQSALAAFLTKEDGVVEDEQKATSLAKKETEESTLLKSDLERHEYEHRENSNLSQGKVRKCEVGYFKNTHEGVLFAKDLIVASK